LKVEELPYECLRFNFWPETLARLASLTYPASEGETHGPLSPRTLADIVSGPQLRSKLGMAQLVMQNIAVADIIEIAGGWIGLLALMIGKSINSVSRGKAILSLDPKFYRDVLGIHSDLAPLLKDVSLARDAPPSTSLLAVNPSCEHFNDNDFRAYFQQYPNGTRFILSSTNMPAEDHVHISHSSFDLELRAKEMGLQGTRRYSLNLGYSYWERFYVTGVLKK
jgi:hypothetical protein